MSDCEKDLGYAWAEGDIVWHKIDGSGPYVIVEVRAGAGERVFAKRTADHNPSRLYASEITSTPPQRSFVVKVVLSVLAMWLLIASFFGIGWAAAAVLYE